MNFKKLSIIIPAYNEGATIHLILDKVKTVDLVGGIEKEIIIVNDFSSDNTTEAVENYIKLNPEMEIQFYHQPKNMG
jgi:glycosyltransferase involved in cell wall biosynthesis